MYRKYIPECPPLRSTRKSISSISAFIISFDRVKAENTRAKFLRHGVKAKIIVSDVNPLTETISLAIRERYKRILVLDDSSVPHCDFRRVLDDIIADDRCGGHIMSDNGNGILLLGPSSEEVVHTKCGNIGNSTVSQPHAVLLHSSVYKHFLKWTKCFNSKYFYNDIIKSGHVVRYASRNVVTHEPRDCFIN